MITLVSIILYAGALLFAAIIGTEAEKRKHGTDQKIVGGSALFFTVLLFVLASILQVSA